MTIILESNGEDRLVLSPPPGEIAARHWIKREFRIGEGICNLFRT
jgi:hypothetical protein